MNEQELNKKLTEWAGLCWHDYKRRDEIDFNAPEMKHLGGYNGYNFRCLKCGGSTDSSLDIYHPNYNFTQSLDACFKGLVPKLEKELINLSIRFFLPHPVVKVTCEIHCWENIGQTGTADTPALALCRAIEKLIDGGRGWRQNC